MKKKCKYSYGLSSIYNPIGAQTPCPYCSHVRIEDTKVEFSKFEDLPCIPPKAILRPHKDSNVKFFKTLRDEFAMAFPRLSDEQLDDEIEPGESPIECQARLSYQYADAMMEEREK